MSSGGQTVNAPSLRHLPRAEGHTFQVPVKKINEGKDVPHFLTSKAYSDIMTFLLQLNRTMFPRKVKPEQSALSKVQVWENSDVPKTHSISKIQDLLGDLDKIIDEIPLDTGPRRFGNVSFRKWYQKVEEQATSLLGKWLPVSFDVSSEVTILDEVIPYFLGSFGSAQRLDYGSGHELSFLAFLGCIWKLDGFADSGSGSISLSQDEQARAIVLGPLQDYFRLIRRLIKTYTLEPAGSHGVWGLDDHSFIPYVFGSAQYGPAISETDETPLEGSLEGAPNPADVAKVPAVNRYRESNLYFGAIGFIHDVKTGPFWEHSPMLYDISGVQGGWGKINKGMIKMYNAEVLSKFPVVQHFPFGSLFSWETNPDAPPPPSSVHASNQPFSLSNGVKSSFTEKVAPARLIPRDDTKAPWATTATPAPRPSGAPAPPAASSLGARTQFPTRSMVPERSLRQPDASNLTPGRPSADSMPPPTRAPWAKEP